MEHVNWVIKGGVVYKRDVVSVPQPTLTVDPGGDMDFDFSSRRLTTQAGCPLDVVSSLRGSLNRCTPTLRPTRAVHLLRPTIGTAMNRRIFLIAPALCLTLCLPLAARADDAAQHARAQELINILHSERALSQLSANLEKQAHDAANQIAGANPSAETTARIQDFDKKVAGLVDAQLSWSVLGPEIVNIYAKAFTEDELTGILNFYKSPAGTAFVAKMPDINTQLNQLAQPKLTTLQSQVGQAFADFRTAQTAAPTGPPTLNTLPPAGPAAPAPKPAMPATPAR